MDLINILENIQYTFKIDNIKIFINFEENKNKHNIIIISYKHKLKLIKP